MRRKGVEARMNTAKTVSFPAQAPFLLGTLNMTQADDCFRREAVAINGEDMIPIGAVGVMLGVDALYFALNGRGRLYEVKTDGGTSRYLTYDGFLAAVTCHNALLF